MPRIALVRDPRRRVVALTSAAVVVAVTVSRVASVRARRKNVL